MTTPTPTPEEENSPQAPAIEMPRMGFLNRVQRELNAEQMHPSEEKEIVVDMTPTIKTTAPDEQS
jgi:hypothetical protein